MNKHDSEHIAGVLEDSGYSRAPTDEEAEIIIMNTCSVRKSAEDKVWGRLSCFAGGVPPPKIVAVGGCMAQLLGESIIDRSPGVRLVFGIGSMDRLPGLIEKSRENPVCDLGDINKAFVDCLPYIPESPVSAWVPVNHGCDNSCSYCIVPAARGNARSRDLDDILREVEKAAGSGRIEVILLGQNVNAYGKDLFPRVRFSQLLDAVSGVQGIQRIKFETSHPADMDESIIEVMAGRANLCEYLHLPAQSGSNRVLKAMNRGYTREDYLEEVRFSRKIIPEISLSTDIIVGFPGETDQDFRDTFTLLEEVRFSNAFIFKYSRRDGTAAAAMRNEVPTRVVSNRFMLLSELQDKITSEALRELEGKTVEVLVGGSAKRGGFRKGRARGNQVVLLSSAQELVEGTLVMARVTGTGKHTARGEVVETITKA
ncbi:MAG: tRNA (N6-isopentenyl adenosine(37)-C2)-methylthiotransferase MiaB [Actinobacteria bacterium]|nr:tRNA (N6-isopentenyl adenosine(37)-C2)-methylthiotransferase MiaB [Actinomycetota bacterium]